MPFDGEVLEGEIMEDDGPAIVVTIVYNALQPSDRTVAEFDWTPGKSLTDYMQGLPEEQSWVIISRDGPLERDRWGEFIPEVDDRFVLILTPEGPVAALIPLVLSVAASAIGPTLAAGLGLAAGTLGASIFTAVFSGVIGILGMLIANALGARVAPTKSNNGPDSSPSYSINGAKNTSAEGSAIPVVYGEFWEGGNLVNFYTENTPNGLSQVAYLQYVVSEGEIESIEDIRINGQPWGYYTNITWDYRTGTLDQSPLGWFASSIEPYQNGSTLTPTAIQYTTHSEVDQFSLELSLPQGLYSIDQHSGDAKSQSVNIVVEFAEHGTGVWQQLGTEYTWISIDPNDSTTPTCTGIRVTVQAQGDSSGATTPYDFTVTWTNETGPPSNNSQQYVGWQYGGFGSPTQGGKAGDTGTLGSDSGVITNQYTVDPSGATSYTPGTITKTFEITGLNGAGYALKCTGGTIIGVEVLGYNNLTLTANERSQLNYTIRSPKLNRGIYDIKISRANAQSTSMYVSDEVILTEVNEIQADTVAYIGTAYYAIRIGLDAINHTNANLISTLTGLPTVVAKVKGRRVGIYDKNGVLTQIAWSNNPADISLDILLNWRNRYGISPSRIDFIAFDRMRQNCAANGLTFNGVFDFETTMWDALMYVMRAGHANMVMSGVKWSVILDAPSDPVMMFTANNIIKDSFQTFWIGSDNRYNSIEVQYYDKNDYNKRHSQFAIDYNALAAGFPIRSYSVNGVGFDDPQQAANEAQLQLNKNLYLLQGCTFDAPIEALGCVVGDVVYVQHDMPQWGYAAIIKSVSGNTLTIDSEIPFDGSNDWHILFIQGATQKATLTVDLVSGNQVRFNGQGSTTGAHRMVINSQDYEVADEVVVGGELVITADRDISGASSGTQVQLWVTDLITEAQLAPVTPTANMLQGDASSTEGFNILSEDGSKILSEEAASEGVRALTISSWVGTQGNPQPNDRVMIGRVGKFKKPFWVTKIGYRDKNIRSMELIEYNQTIYDGAAAVPTPNYSDLTIGPSQVLNLKASQSQQQLQGGSMSYYATCTWDSPLNDSHIYAGAKVFVSTNYGGFNLVSSIPRGANSFTMAANVGDLIRFKVVAYDQAQESADFNAAPIAAVQIGASARVPQAPTNVVVTPGIRQVAIRWDDIADDYVKGFEIWENDSQNTLADAYIEWAGRQNHFVRTGLIMGQTVYLWVRTVSITGVYSAWAGPFSASPTYALTDDIGDAILTTAKFAQSIKPVALLTDLSGSGVTNQIYFNEGDLKLYKWVVTNGIGAWVAVVNTTDLSGTVSDAQIAAVAATKLTGSITATQITDGAVSSPKLAAGAVTAGKIDTGAVQAGNIAAGAVEAGNIAANAVQAGNVAADAITAGTVAAGAISSTEIASGSIKATHLASEEIISEAVQIANGVIETVHIGDAQITTAKIGSLQVGTGNIATSAVTNVSAASGATTASVTLACDGSPVIIWGCVTVNGNAANGSNGYVATANMTRDGTTITSGQENVAFNGQLMTVPLLWLDYPTAGNHTYAVSPGSGEGSTACVVCALQIKR